MLALQFRDFSATALRHTIPDARGQTPGTRDEHLQVCFLALTHSLMPEKVPNRGTTAKPIPGVPKVPNSGRRSAKRITAPNPGARKRETDTEQQASSGQENQIFTPPHDRSVSSGPGSLSPQRQRLAALKRNRPNSSV